MRAGPDELLDRLRAAIDGVLGPQVVPGAPCALLDFPNHGNVGDSAIWLGTRAWLRARGVPVAYAATIDGYRREHLEAAMPEGPVLLSGGGNLGDLWPEPQDFRERVIADFPDRRIVQLPQTVCFRERTALDRARAVFGAHRDLTLLVRDVHSLATARDALDVPSFACPDLALALGLLSGPDPRTPIVYLARGDHERRAGESAALGEIAPPVDWTRDRPAWMRRLVPGAARGSGGLGLYDAAARRRLARGRALLGRGEVVISDRLHGHVISLLLGRPHVIVPDAFGKLRAFHNTWTAGAPLVHWADSPADALAVARGLLDGAHASVRP